MALPPIPPGYQSWNQYIEEQGAIIAAAQGLTFQQGKASAKLLYVSEPVRSAVGTPSYRQYNVFTTWSARQVIPQPNLDPDVPVALGRPWRSGTPPIGGLDLTTLSGDSIVTISGDNIVTSGVVPPVGDDITTLGGDILTTIGGDTIITQ